MSICDKVRLSACSTVRNVCVGREDLLLAQMKLRQCACTHVCECGKERVSACTH